MVRHDSNCSALTTGKRSCFQAKRQYFSGRKRQMDGAKMWHWMCQHYRLKWSCCFTPWVTGETLKYTKKAQRSLIFLFSFSVIVPRAAVCRQLWQLWQLLWHCWMFGCDNPTQCEQSDAQIGIQTSTVAEEEGVWTCVWFRRLHMWSEVSVFC